jgi:uncharacterized repeat protein (TIGR01451 family)
MHMRVMNLRALGGIALGLTLAAGAGCQNQQPARTDSAPLSEPFIDWSRVGNRTTEAPAPAERPEPRRTTPAPARGGDGMSTVSMALPTGQVSTSALLLERVTPVEVTAGQDFGYEIRVTNLTDLSLRDVIVTDEGAQGFTLVSSAPQATARPPVYTWNLGTFGPSEVKTIRVTGRASGVGSLQWCAGATWSSALCATTNVVQPALQVAISAPSEALLCDQPCVTITATNNGTGVARDVTVNYTLPEGWTTLDGRNAFSQNIGALAAGESRSVEVCVKPGRTGNFQSQASATAAGNLSAQSTQAVTAVRQPVLTLAADCPEGNQLIGRNATFRFTVTNTGDAVSNNTVVTAALPAGGQFASADAGGVQQGNSVVFNVGALAPGQSRTVSYVVRTTGAGTLNTTATASGVCATQVSANCDVTVIGVPDLGTLLTDDQGVRLVGEDQPYRYEVANQGQVNLTNVRMVLSIPEGMTFVSSTAAAQPRVQGNRVEFLIGTLPVGQRLSFTFTLRGTRPQEFLITTETSAAELRNPSRNDEQTNYIPAE